MQQGFTDRFGRDPRRLQLLFISDADKSCQLIPQLGGEQPGNPPEIFKNMFS